jgi:hypothetical protein
MIVKGKETENEIERRMAELRKKKHRHKLYLKKQ